MVENRSECVFLLKDTIDEIPDLNWKFFAGDDHDRRQYVTLCLRIYDDEDITANTDNMKTYLSTIIDDRSMNLIPLPGWIKNYQGKIIIFIYFVF